MLYNFIKFEDLHKRVEDRITVTKSASIGFPTQFYKNNQIGTFKYVMLFYDQSQMAIGIKFTSDENEKSKFTIIHSKIGYGGNIIARSFFRTNNIDTKRYYGRYEWEKHNQEGVGELFVIKLKERITQEGP